MYYLFLLTILFKHGIKQCVHALRLVQTEHIFSMFGFIYLIFIGLEGVILGTGLADIERHVQILHSLDVFSWVSISNSVKMLHWR